MVEISSQLADLAPLLFLKHEAMKRLERRFRQERIEIPHPTRSVLLASPEKGSAAGAAV